MPIEYIQHAVSNGRDIIPSTHFSKKVTVRVIPAPCDNGNSAALILSLTKSKDKRHVFFDFSHLQSMEINCLPSTHYLFPLSRTVRGVARVDSRYYALGKSSIRSPDSPAHTAHCFGESI